MPPSLKMKIEIVSDDMDKATDDNVNSLFLVRFLIRAGIVSTEVGGAYLWTVWEPM